MTADAEIDLETVESCEHCRIRLGNCGGLWRLWKGIRKLWGLEKTAEIDLETVEACEDCRMGHGNCGVL